MRASAHFDYDPNATYIIMTPPRPSRPASRLLRVPHADDERQRDRQPVPARVRVHPVAEHRLAGLGQGCGLHNVNATSNAFGNGIFDSWSIVVGHEYAEAVTDPDNFFAIQDGWNDAQTSENGDKCAWTKRRTSRSAATSSRCSPTGATRRSTPARTAAPSPASQDCGLRHSPARGRQAGPAPPPAGLPLPAVAHPDLPLEQAYVDDAYACLDRMREALERSPSAGAGEVAQEALEAWASRRLVTFADAERGLCFGRIDVETTRDPALRRPPLGARRRPRRRSS